MPCIQPYRGDTSQMLLFKIASCIAEGGAVAGVASFNGRTGVVTLTSADVIAALGCTPACDNNVVTSFNGRQGVVTLTEADVSGVADGRYVLKSGDTMTGSLNIANSAPLVASDPALDITQTWNNAAVTFTGLQSNITNTASSTNSNLFNFQVDGSDRFNFTAGGTLRAIRQAADDLGVNFFLRKRGNAGGATNAVAADSTIGSISYSGWDGTAFATGSHIDGLAAEAWTNVAHGSRLTFYTTPIGSTTEQISLRLDANGQARFLDGTAALPALTFQSDPDTGIYRLGANSFGLSAGGALIFDVATDGVNLTTGLAYQYNAVNVIRAQTALNNYFFGPSGNLTMTGGDNTSLGFNAFVSNTTGIRNVAIGYQALPLNTTGESNVAIGYEAQLSNVAGSNNLSIGHRSLYNATGSSNTGFGFTSLFDLTTGSQNVAIGYRTGMGLTTGSNNTIIGANVIGLAAGLSNNIILADGAGVIRLQIDSSGNTTLAGTVATAAGTAALPAHTFSADLDTGIYRVGANHLGVSANGAVVLGVGAAALGFFAAVAAAPVAQQVSGANLTNNVTAGGVNDTIADYADLVIYANDAAAIRNDIYQLARKLKQVNDALRAYGLLT